MKKNRIRRCRLGFFLLLGTCYVLATEPADVILPVMEKGNATQLCTYLASDAELIILGKTVQPQRQCSELQAFFAANKPDGFTIKHKGTKLDAYFIVGTLETEKQHYRVNLFVRNHSESVSIQQLRIEKE